LTRVCRVRLRSLQGSLEEPIESGADVRSPDGRWLLSGILDSESQAAIVYNVLQITPDGAERLQTTRGESFPAPVWLPDSSGLLYWSEPGSLCLLNIAAGSRDCREAVYGSLSNVVVDPLIAYVTEAEGGYQLCIAPVVDQTFGDTSCPVTHTQLPGDAYRPNSVPIVAAVSRVMHRSA